MPVAARQLSLLLVLLLAACSPRLQEIGPPVDEPAFTEKAFHTADGVDLPLKIWLPWDRPIEGVIVALHGFNDYSRAFDAPGKGLARRGFALYAYDQRGFGRTPARGIWAGTEQMVADLIAAAQLAKEANPGKPLFLLGESMGAAVIMAAYPQLAAIGVDGVILSAPAIWGWQVQPAVNRFMMDLAMAIMPGVAVQPRGVERQASSNINALRQLARDPNFIKATRVDTAYGLVELMTRAFDAGPTLDGDPRWLILYGAREDILPGGAVARFLDSLPDLPPEQGRVAYFKQGHHLLLRDLDARFVYDDIATWMRDAAAPLPSGADRSAE
jgi:alpha-beta hydrolase superfamily lysophospholipase